MSKNNAWDDDNTSSPKKTEKVEKTLTPDTNNLIVKIIEDDTQYVNIRLGITEKRKTELHSFLAAEMIKNHEIGIILTNLSKHCLHANELAYISFALGRKTNESQRPGGSLAARVRAISIGKDGVKGHGLEDGEELPDFVKDILRDILNRDKGKGKDKDKE